MSRLSRFLLATLVVVSAAFARADELRLIAPAHGATLRGGSSAELHWSADTLPADAEEWEAFLSVDGGRYYGFRITPHLDIERRSFTFVVPNFETNDARILIRAGDEKHEETEFESTSTFAIVRDPNVEAALPKLADLDRGEAAREGDPDVVAWTEGDRDGSGVKQETAFAPPPPSMGWSATIEFNEVAAVESEEDSAHSPLLESNQNPARLIVARASASLPATVDVLLLCRRLNI